MDRLDHLDKTGPLVYQAYRVLLELLVSLDSEEPRATMASWDFQEQQGRSHQLQTPASLAASSLSLLHLLQVLRVTQDRRGLLGRPAWRGSPVPWGQLDLQGHLDHLDRRTAPALTAVRDLRTVMACLDTEASLDHRVQLGSPDFLVNQVSQVSLGAKEQRDLEDPLGYRVWMDSPDSRARKAKEERKDRWVCQVETEGRLAPQGPPGLPVRWCTSQEKTRDRAFQAGLDSLALQGPKEIKETPVYQVTPPRDKKESRASSWGQMGDLCTWVAWLDCRVSLGVQVQRVLWVLMVLRDRRERLASPADQVDLDSMESKERGETLEVEMDSGILVLQVPRGPPDLLDLLLPWTELEGPRTTPGGTP